ncbi:pyridoxamine 5'-phosphate oxidase family protein [Microbacterium sp. 2FI]|uniref:pyridoxamine 5'-phosphate oxidase family protein n=1 Tax=Microbacterium sp. 2FI TaxID=2502193 RepID=UPI0010F4BF60|nr:pyridoxamine 5'-phosphate oxidase family protein [Microbacterium sp. 2FI]
MSDAGGPPRAEIISALRTILASGRLLTLATVSPDGRAHANIAYFAYEPDLRVRIVSPVDTEHSRNLETNQSAAVTVFDSRQDRTARRGVQLFGTMSLLGAEAAEGALVRFAERFADVPQPASHGHSGRAIYEFVPERAKVFDEELLIAGDYVAIDFGREDDGS